MRRDSRLSSTLHALLHLAERQEAITSEALAERMGMHPVVVRRTMAGLREAGILASEKGHGGGWRLVRRLEEVTLTEVYHALGMSTVFSIGNRSESPTCLLEQAANRAMAEALEAAEALLLQKLERVTVADLAADAKKRMPAKKSKLTHKRSHHV